MRLVDDAEEPLTDADQVSLTDADRAELRASIKEIDDGDFITAEQLFVLLALKPRT